MEAAVETLFRKNVERGALVMYDLMLSLPINITGSVQEVFILASTLTLTSE